MNMIKFTTAAAVILSCGQAAEKYKTSENDIEEEFNRCVLGQAEICKVSADDAPGFNSCMSQGSANFKFHFDGTGNPTTLCGLHYPKNYLSRCTRDAHLVTGDRSWAATEPKKYSKGLEAHKDEILGKLLFPVGEQGIICAVSKDDEAARGRCLKKGSVLLSVPFDGSKPTVSSDLHYPHAYRERDTGELEIYRMVAEGFF